MSAGETVDVVQTVVKIAGQPKFLIGLRTRDDYWEFLGGKLEEDETVKQAGIRELEEETGLDLFEEDLLSYREGETYRSKKDEKYRLNPVLMEIEPEKAEEVSVEDLSREHKDFEWISLNEFYSYETLGQYRALENLDLIEGDVALAVAEKNDELLALKRSEETSSSGLWNFPGGKIEGDEEKAEAAARELEEETGLNGEIIESGEPYINDGELGYWRIFPFLVRVEGEPELNHEHSDFSWVNPGELEDMETLGTSQAVENLELE